MIFVERLSHFVKLIRTPALRGAFNESTLFRTDCTGGMVFDFVWRLVSAL